MRERRSLVRGIAVSEIHAHPLRPARFEEPLFPTLESRRAVAEYLRESSPWLFRASELVAGGEGGGGGETARRLREPVRILRQADGEAYLVRCGFAGRGRRTTKRRVARVLERWREVGRWWDEGGGVDRFVFRVLLAGHGPRPGAVMDLAFEKPSGEWLLVGVVD